MRFIHVGVGGFGQCWVRALKDNKNAKVVGLVDVKDEALRKACEIGGYSKDLRFKSLEEALKNVKADAGVSSTPPALHRHDVVTAMNAGLDVISEKPMADTMASCKAMARAAAETGRIYVVSQNYRYSPPITIIPTIGRKARISMI
jgi:predicted dehydrogenase